MHFRYVKLEDDRQQLFTQKIRKSFTVDIID